MMEGTKDDNNKVRFDLIPPEPLWATATILTLGASKYTDRNWEKGMTWGRMFSACMRHLWCWWAGPNKQATHNFLFGPTDEETGHSHLWHALTCLMFLVTYEERQLGTDNRRDQNSTNSGNVGVSEDPGFSQEDLSRQRDGTLPTSPGGLHQSVSLPEENTCEAVVDILYVGNPADVVPRPEGKTIRFLHYGKSLKGISYKKLQFLERPTGTPPPAEWYQALRFCQMGAWREV